MSGLNIAAEVSAALAEVAQEVGSGTFAVTLIRKPLDAPTEPWGTPGVGNPQEFELSAILDRWSGMEVDGERILATDKKVMLEAAVDVEPTVEDRLLIGDVEHDVISVMPEAPSGVPLYYILQCRA